ncbi:MAG: hypothetical protein JNK72_04540 [Myxococcales bacterium]|nr:hypothetical protein [Myxococcales bacterium]
MRRTLFLGLLTSLGAFACTPTRVGNSGSGGGDAQSDVTSADQPAAIDSVAVDTGPVARDAGLDVPPAEDAPGPTKDAGPGPDVPAEIDVFVPPVDVPVAQDAGPQDAGPQDAGPQDTGVSVDTPSSNDGGTACRSDRECSSQGQVCDTMAGQCVQCVLQADCTMNQRCVANRCVDNRACTSSTQCPGQVCDRERGFCVDCVGDNDCPVGQVCGAQRTCVVATPTCTPGAATCLDATTRQVCNTDGRTYATQVCPSPAGSAGFCSAGACAIRCNAGFADCNRNVADGCEVNLSNDRNHCNACGSACASGTVCTAGRCESVCSTGQTNCNGVCVNLLTDPQRCGSCSTVCLGGQSCVNGTCQTPACPSGQTRCNGVCVDVTSNSQHCGACGSACAPGAVCFLGFCSGGSTCTGNQRDCNSNTADGCETNIATSGEHCGACGNRCPTGVSCNNGSCNGVPGSGATLITGLGGTSGYGPFCVAAGDDTSYSAPVDGGTTVASPIALTGPFASGVNFFGVTYTSFYLNNNGNISFRQALSTYSPVGFPQAAGSVPLIGPWWADVDTRGGTPPTNNTVCAYVDSTRVIATWHNVGYYNQHHDRLNAFQLIMSRPSSGAAASDFDLEFRYNRCQWTTGDASGGTGGLGGTPASGGFDGGGSGGYALPGSRTATVVNLCTTSNVNVPGVWRFRFRNGQYSQ